MSLDERSTAILHELVRRDGYLSVKELIKRFNISRRTVYYDIEKINYWLKSNHLDGVKYVRTSGFYVTERTKQAIPEKLKNLEVWNYAYSEKERIAWLAIHLLVEEPPLFLKDLSEKTKVSRNTTIKDLKKLRVQLNSFQLTLCFTRYTGYVIKGKEEDKRRAIVYYLSLVVPHQQDWQTVLANLKRLLIHDEDESTIVLSELRSILDVLNECEKHLNIQFADDVLYHLALRFWLFGKRIVQGKKIDFDPVEKEVIQQTKEFKAAQTARSKLESIFQTSIPDDEVYYLATHLLSSKVQYSGNYLQSHDDYKNLQNIVQKMVTEFQAFTCITFPNRKAVEENLLLHLKPAYYRIKYGLQVENPMIELIKTKYKDLFLITKKVIHHFETAIGKKVSDEEIALIAIHFGGWLRKEGIEPKERKRAILICASGIGTSTILRKQLEGLFSTVDFVETISVRDYEQRDFHDIDFAVSTVPVSKKKHPVFVVNPILTDQEKETLLKKVHALFGEGASQNTKYSPEAILGIVKQYADIKDEQALLTALKEYFYKPFIPKNWTRKPGLLDLLSLEYIQIAARVESWEHAIELASKPLLRTGRITRQYVVAMINHIKNLGPYIIIAPKVALPHGKPDEGVKKPGISLLVLKEPVSFSKKKEHDVQLIFVLASVDPEIHLHALSTLSECFQSSEFVEELIRCDTPVEIWSYLKKKISEDNKKQKGD
ncbi:BglG family transcription antiterminator [Saccharococcus caldoxylosilyticus]|uniref:BglG family transcription antiterminator n=1 Tax=Saccharococcus caldoxylosilyticus TaxID=81408 RepID=UPI001FCC347F|nr:BglG family transcription antiterminator [Parageobacillus caldoxylosilyticus]BDG35437.1 transcriptional antiterminator [Parageobacillus caldoxylosilyticus]BDG39215.1 transcriptional antiterminator [Parageobacillus caldoxylosilyticus]